LDEVGRRTAQAHQLIRECQDSIAQLGKLGKGMGSPGVKEVRQEEGDQQKVRENHCPKA
jgi:hypothetical protein